MQLPVYINGCQIFVDISGFWCPQWEHGQFLDLLVISKSQGDLEDTVNISFTVLSTLLELSKTHYVQSISCKA